jgi:glyoxylase-like metal-dependent hydrolase (beta-lactamase superfamily II)
MWTPEQVTVTTIAPHVVRLEGGQGVSTYGGGVPYYSVAVQQGDSIVVVEAPVSDERMRLVLDTLRARFPNSPAKTFIVTHAHYDHTSGVRAAFDAGLRAVAARDLTEFVRRVGLAPGQQAARARTVTAVDDSLAIGTGDSRFVLHRVPSVHARGLLLAYFPAHKLIVESDLQGLATSTQQHELLDWVRARRLDVERIVGLHGDPVTWEQFVSTVK